AKSGEERQTLFKEKYPGHTFAPRFLAHAQKYPKDMTAFQALTWVMTQHADPIEGTKIRTAALAILQRDYLENDKLGDICQALGNSIGGPESAFLRSVLDKSPHPAVKAEACLALTQSLQQQSFLAKRIQDDPKEAKGFEAILGKEELHAL